MSWRLVNAEKREESRTAITLMSGSMPSRRMRETLSVGNLAMLLFERDIPDDDEPLSERLPVRITAVKDKAGITRGRSTVEYTGVVHRAPSRLRAEIRQSEIVTFGPEHIFDWEPSP